MNRASRQGLGFPLLFLIPVALAIACSAPSPPPPERTAVEPDVQRELIAAHLALIDAYEKQDVDAFVALLDPSPDLLIFHPMTGDRFHSIPQIRTEMGRMFKRLGKVNWTDVHPAVMQRGDVAWITSNVLIDAANLPQPFLGRGTEIWVRTAAGWRLIHAHWSRDPSSELPND